MNLTTEITNIAFNHDAQMMAVSSSKKKDAFRMVSTERRRNTNGEFTLIINVRSGFVVPPAIRHGVYELADLVHPTWGCHMFRLFSGERVRGDGEYTREDSLVQRRALQAARCIGRGLYVDRDRLVEMLFSATMRSAIKTFYDLCPSPRQLLRAIGENIDLS
jgi:hypothetical protein